MRNYLALTLLLVASLLSAQSPAPGCFFSETFDGPGIPSGWNIGSPVLLLGPQGDTLGGTTDAWSIGNATSADANGYFPVPDLPFGNSFVMANDDAAPCNCDMSDVVLSSPSIDLSSRTGSVLEYRIFHEGLYGVGDPILEVSTNGGGSWTTLETINPVADVWQEHFVDMTSFDGMADVSIRFSWNDSLNWSSGVAVDDICFSERFDTDISLLNVYSEEIADNTFDPTVRTLEYTIIPLSQVAELQVGAEVMNRGTLTLTNVVVNISVDDPLGPVGTFSTPSIASLAPGESQKVFVATGYTPSVSGPVQIDAEAVHAGSDDDATDNTGIKSFDVSQPGAQYAFSLMGSAGSTPEHALHNDSNEVGMGILIETLGAGDQIYGIGVLLDPSTAAGTTIQAVLLDETLLGLDTSLTDTIDPSHISQSMLGNYMFLPFDSSYTITQDRDLYAMVYSSGAVDGSFLSVATSGTSPLGGALFFDGTNDTWDYPTVTPMIRAYFSNPFAVGISEDINPDDQLLIYPNPAVGLVHMSLNGVGQADLTWEIYSVDGSLIANGQSSGTQNIDVSDWGTGIYVARVTSKSKVLSRQFIVSH